MVLIWDQNELQALPATGTLHSHGHHPCGDASSATAQLEGWHRAVILSWQG